MYFEDIFNKVRVLWKKEYKLSHIKETETYIQDLADTWEEIDYLVSFKEKYNYNEWERMMLFVMYQVITEYGLYQFKLGELSIDIDNIPIIHYEKKYVENLQYEGNEKYLEKYKGFKKLNNSDI